MLLKSLEEYTVNRSFILPLVGKVTFNSDNQIEVTDEEAEKLLSYQMGVKLSKVMEETIELEEISKIEEVEIIEKGEELEDLPENKVDVLEMLNKMSNKELQELLKEYPKNETQKLNNRSSMISYLKKKLNA